MQVTGRTLLVVGLVSCAGGIGLAIAAVPALYALGASDHPISPIDPQPVMEPWVLGTITVDAQDRTKWTYFDFSRGSVVEDAIVDGHNWDLAFQRYRVATNGGTTNPNGFAGAIKFGKERPLLAPEDGYQVDDWEHDITYNHVFRRWYRYSPMANGLVSRGDYFIIRTADHGYAWLRFGSYHCPKLLGGGHGCITFDYGYRSDFSRELSPAVARLEAIAP